MITAAIVHYHLDRGGVATVIAATSRALTQAGIRHVILIGNPPPPSLRQLPVQVVAGLGYTGADEQLADRLRLSASKALGTRPDIWHFHNHSLGKNPAMAEAVACFAEAGERLVLHLHDLAEDGRPGNYPNIGNPARLYPGSPRIHYAFLNSRDLETFRAAGLGPASSSVLANPVSISAPPPQTDAPALLFAPIRGIRRKNLGELVFLSALAPAGVRFAISRAPANPNAIAIHDRWVWIALSHGLPIEFDVTDRLSPTAHSSCDFASWLEHSTHIVTTSVAEGFGLPFLESISLGRPLIGRNLPHLTTDHARHGLIAGNLYDQLLIPSGWVNLTRLRRTLESSLEAAFHAYGKQPTTADQARVFALMRHGDFIDFGNLPEPIQAEVIARMIHDSLFDSPRVRVGTNTIQAREWLTGAICNRIPRHTARELGPYTPEFATHALIATYQNLMRQPTTGVGFLSSEAILSRFVTAERFHFLCTPPTNVTNFLATIRAVIFDIYGTLLVAPPGRVQPDPAADPLLRKIIARFGHTPPKSPSQALHAAVQKHHAQANSRFPEIDLRLLWREVLDLRPDADTTALVAAIEAAWHPSSPMPGALEAAHAVAESGRLLGLLSNAQCNTLDLIEDIRHQLQPDLVLLSYLHGVAKPDPELFQSLAARLNARGISPTETLFIGNDPLQDIAPANHHGFKTALFIGHPDSLRQGHCEPHLIIRNWGDFTRLLATATRDAAGSTSPPKR